MAAIKQYRYVAENALKIDAMLGATRLAVRTLMEQINVTPKELSEQIERFSKAERTKDHFPELDALAGLQSIFENLSVPMELGSGESVRELVDVVWNYVFMHYFWIIDRI